MTAINLVLFLFLVLYSSFINSSTINYIDNDFESLELLEEIILKIKEEYIENIENKTIVENALNGILSKLDQYSGYLNDKSFHAIQMQTKGEFSGIGIEITKDKNRFIVSSIMEGTPAYDSQIKVGDCITHLDDELLDNLSLEKITSILKGDVGSTIRLKLKNHNEEKTLSLKRSIIKISSINFNPVENIAYIKILYFNANTSDDLKTFWKNFNEKYNFKGILLDLRNNKGGLLSQAVEVCDAFLDGGNIVSIKGKNTKNDKIYVAHSVDMFKKIPTVVLINNNSASAAEIVAGALQDHKRALIVGNTSFGKGSVQTLIPIRGGGAIRITNALYYTPLNHSINKKGIIPDIHLDKLYTLSKCNTQMNKRYKRVLKKDDCQLFDAIDVLQGFIT